MNDLAANLERLGLEQYIDAFIGEGFDTWETLCDIQESDLESLNVKLGHRRKLQRAIAEHRGISYQGLIGSPAQEGPSDTSRATEGPGTQGQGRESTGTAPVETKRKYRRHPKPDENAPDKPPSAYVLFSNQVRNEVKAENLSFTEIAKLVGDRWQKLETSQKEPFETQANRLKESYTIQHNAYKETDAYKEYCRYLAEFKAKHGPNTEAKRPKLDPQSSTGSASVASVASQQDAVELQQAVQSHGRVSSVSSVGTTSFTGALAASPSSTLLSVASLPNLTTSIHRPLQNVPRTASPPLAQFSRERRTLGQLSTASSVSDESGPNRPEVFDPLSRTATLSLSTPPTGTSPLPSYAPTSARSEHSVSSDHFSWPTRPLQTSPPAPNIPSLGTVHPTESWRDRGIEAFKAQPLPGQQALHVSSPSLPLPTAMGVERMPEMMRTSVQRTLPPLRQSTSNIQPAFGYQPVPTTTSSFFPSSGGLGGGPLQHYPPPPPPPSRDDSSPRPVHENEAANTLAGLASRPGSNARQHDHARRPPH